MERPQTLLAMFLRSLHPVPVPSGRSWCLAWSQGRHHDPVGQSVRPDEDPEGGSFWNNRRHISGVPGFPAHNGSCFLQIPAWNSTIVSLSQCSSGVYDSRDYSNSEKRS